MTRTPTHFTIFSMSPCPSTTALSCDPAFSQLTQNEVVQKSKPNFFFKKSTHAHHAKNDAIVLQANGYECTFILQTQLDPVVMIDVSHILRDEFDLQCIDQTQQMNELNTMYFIEEFFGNKYEGIVYMYRQTAQNLQTFAIIQDACNKEEGIWTDTTILAKWIITCGENVRLGSEDDPNCIAAVILETILSSECGSSSSFLTSQHKLQAPECNVRVIDVD